MEHYDIVIADDEAYVTELLAKQLNQEGSPFHVVGRAQNGQEALEIIEKESPDILLTDICMPVMDGLELIRELHRKGIRVKPVIISGYDDFDYARQAMSLGVTDYLLKPFSKEEVIEVLEKIAADIDHQEMLMNNIHQMELALEDSRQLYLEQFFRRILDDKISASEIEKEAPGLGLNGKISRVAAGIIRMSAPGGKHEKELTGLLDSVGDNIFGEKVSVYFLNMGGRQIVAVFLGTCSNDLSFKRAIADGMGSIRESLARYYDYPFGCVVGGIYEDMSGLSRSYRQAMSVWKTMLDYEPLPIFYDDLAGEKADEQSSAKRPTEAEGQLLRAIEMGQEDKAGEILYEILRYYEGIHVDQGEFVSVSLAEMVFDISDALQKAGGADPLWEDEELVKYLKEHFEYGSLWDTHRALQQYISRCCSRFAMINEKQGDRIVYQVKELIEHNISNEELSLESVSGMLYFSPNYVRQIFKQITGESFMTYLIRRRMETAGELLRNEEVMIQDVAAMTGYSNQRYFASCFKKYYGTTPTDYRRGKDGKDVSGAAFKQRGKEV
ncbi:response regulator [Butyrivibrio sp. MC2013]|uniref:response regulator n=1 Tax=Butyrivibrio sp. MC2013 TaxID=1280686 RepID=UPI00040F8F1C|nr:response regulator [Butyrivibrio sp. MC2013]